MAAIDGLTEVAGRAALAEGIGRSASWQDRAAIGEATSRVDRALASDREALSRPPLGGMPPSAL